jgi:hypothetical protein
VTLTPLSLALALTVLVWIGVGAALILRNPAPRADPWGLIPAVLSLAAFLPTCVAAFSGADIRGLRFGAGTSLSRGLNALLLLGIGLLLIRAIVSRLAVTPSNALLTALLVAYWFVGLASDWEHGLHAGALSFYVVPFALLAAAILSPSPVHVLRTLRWTGFAVCASSLGLGLIDAQKAFFLPSRYLGRIEVNRLAGVLPQPNTLGYVAGISLVCAFSTPLRLRTRLITAIVCGTALLLSESRGSWLAIVAVGAMAVGARRFGPAKGRALTPAYFALVTIALFSALIFVFGSHSANLASANGRTTIWRFVLSRWKDSPLVGVGPHAWGDLIATGAVPAAAGQAHNQLLESLFTLGLVGTLLLLGIATSWMVVATRAISSTGEWVHLYLVLFVFTSALFESPLVLGGIEPRTWFIALAVAALPKATTHVATATTQDPRPVRLARA